ncbi:hypothetical protein ACFVS2_26205 [Brevibacillus sp. NPDC058079]|uniref:hypothetical protein n=1 Tax=Brevibacillus sp. NPDC058079 TaxID=3346330 RepID=UPI0036E721C3
MPFFLLTIGNLGLNIDCTSDRLTTNTNMLGGRSRGIKLLQLRYIMNESILSRKNIKQSIVEGFLDLIRKIPDDNDRKSIMKLVNYLNGLLRIKEVTPPVSEIMSLIKDQKPNLYYATKMNIHRNSHLTMLFGIEMNPEIATERLQAFSKEVNLQR